MKEHKPECAVSVAKRGFTMVEIIVVSAIVMILAAVAIPMYLAYVEGARKDAAANLAGTVAAAASSYYKKTGSVVTAAQLAANTGSLKLFYDPAKYSVTAGAAGTAGYIVVTDRYRASVTASVPYR
jgi:prepilin-type N-terminal cleavage/methylation domain-containing protein